MKSLMLALSTSSGGLTPMKFLRSDALRDGRLVCGTVIIGLIVLIAVAAPLLAPADPYAQNLAARLKPPVWAPAGTWEHVLGTDAFGRDYLSRLLYGARISLLVGFATIAISGVIGISLGMIGGFFGGRIDAAIMFIITTRLSIPVVLIAAAVTARTATSATIVILVLGGLLWDRFAILARAGTQQVRSMEYIDAARSSGVSTFRILIRHVIPNIAPLLIAAASLEMSNAILLEAALSYLGMGVPPPLPSWGLMIAQGKSYMLFQPWLIMAPGFALFVLILGTTIIGNSLSDRTSSLRGSATD